jgi:hypothetical protein
MEYFSNDWVEKFEYISELLNSGRLYTAESERFTASREKLSIPSNDCLYTDPNTFF